MKHLLTREILGYRVTMPLSEEEFKKLKAMRTVLFEGLALERNYDLLIANYIEFEEEHLRLAVQSAVRLDWDYKQINEMGMRLNQRIFNLLSSARLYLDSYKKHLKKIKLVEMGKVNTESIKKFEKDCIKHYFEFKFMEALRNYSQHCGLPVHFASWNLQVLENKESAQAFEQTIDFASDPCILKRDHRCEAEILQGIGEKVDLKLSTRKYMECLGTIHEKVRREISSILKTAREYISGIMELYKKEFDPELTLLSVFTILEDGKRRREFPLLLDWDDIRIALENRNDVLKGIGSLYVTGKSKITDKCRK